MSNLLSECILYIKNYIGLLFVCVRREARVTRLHNIFVQ